MVGGASALTMHGDPSVKTYFSSKPVSSLVGPRRPNQDGTGMTGLVHQHRDVRTGTGSRRREQDDGTYTT